MSRHAADWTGGRIFADRFIGRTTPGKHHAIWDVDVNDPLISDREAFDYLARRLFGDRK